MIPPLRPVPHQVGRAGARGADTQAPVSISHSPLLLREVGLKPHLAPGAEINAGGIESRRHGDASALIGPLTEEVKAGWPQVTIADASHLHRLYRNKMLRTIDPSEGNHEFHGPGHARPCLTIKQGLLLRG
jgi:hypothetical protein